MSQKQLSEAHALHKRIDQVSSDATQLVHDITKFIGSNTTKGTSSTYIKMVMRPVEVLVASLRGMLHFQGYPHKGESDGKPTSSD